MPHRDKLLTQQANELIMLKELMNEVGAYIFTKDLNGCYLYANKLVLDLFQCSLESIIGKDDSQFFDLSTFNDLQENDRLVIEEGLAIEKEETNIVKATGEKRVYWTIKKPLYNNKNEVIALCGISSDITEQKLLQDQLKQKNDLLHTIVNNIDAHVYIRNINREFTFVNEKCADLFNMKAEDIIGKKDIDILPQDIALNFRKLDDQVFNSNSKITGHESFTDTDSNIFHYQTTKVPITLDSNIPSLIGFSTDVTELFKLKEKLKKQASIDDLSGLFNRRHFLELAGKAFSRSQRQNICISLLYIDVDFFKSINDIYGHPVGDAVISAVGENLLSLLRNEDIAGRIGGEEFAILLSDTSKDKAMALALRICKAQAGLSLKGNWQGSITPTVSIGVAFFSKNDHSIDGLINRADRALYQAKNNGRNQVSTI